MCGRYRLSRRKQLVEEYFDTVSGEEEWTPRYNIAPTQPVPVVRQHPKEPRRDLSLMRWGLIPSWAKDTSGATRMINARSETAHTLPAFREAMKLRRCLVPADGFYEWQRRGSAKQPFCFEVGDGGLFAFAGLWERWRDPSGQSQNFLDVQLALPRTETNLNLPFLLMARCAVWRPHRREPSRRIQLSRRNRRLVRDELVCISGIAG
jgi:putative SOS response-associated peptidase YedK